MKGRCDAYSGMPGTRCVLMQGHSGKHEFFYATAVRRKKPGRPPRSRKAAGLRFELRLTEQERARWQRAADREGMTLAEFVRAAVEAVAK